MRRQAGAAFVTMFLAHAAGAQFTQQGSKLVGTGAIAPARQGNSVAISADGNTAILGGPEDNTFAGAAWVYSRRGVAWSQQGGKLDGAGAVGDYVFQGWSVAISADGNTAIVGGPVDNASHETQGEDIGAAWAFARSGGAWSQQGDKLVGSGAIQASHGISVAISADGNTAIVGGYYDSGGGAAWVFTRSAGVWTQQGSKLVGTGAVWRPGPFVGQGFSVAISGDGNTAIVGGPNDDDNVGAAWVFTRSGGVWSQQRNKLVGSGAAGPAWQGYSVAISGDGNTVIIGGPNDTPGTDPPYGTGAAWVFTRTGEVWSQQGNKLLGSGAVGSPSLGHSVSISADGNTAVVGGPADNPSQDPSGEETGAAWVYTRSGGVWTQQGGKLVGAGAIGGAVQGNSVAISADGNTVIVGGPGDNFGTGAAWIFSTSNSSVVWVPVASHISGLNGSEWRSDLGLLNLSSAAVNAQIAFYGSSGVASTTTSVPPGVQAVLPDVVGQLGASGSGTLEITADQPLKVTARSYNQVASTASCYAGGTQGQDYPAVAASDGLSEGQSAYLAGLSENPSARTNIGLVSVGSGAALVAVALFDGAGTELISPYSVDLNSGEWKQETEPFLNKAKQRAVLGGYARITVQSGSGVFAFASVIDNITNDPTTIAMQRSAPSSVVWVPVASHNAGLNHSAWRSDLGLLNTGTVQANVLVSFFGGNGVVSKTAYVAPGAQSILTDVVGQLGGSGSGALEVLSDQPLNATARSYNLVSSSASCYAGGTQGQDYPALLTSDGLAATQSAYLAGLSENVSSHCNIGVVNTGAATATVLVELLDGAGVKLTDYTVTLNPGDWKQETQPFLNKAGQTAMDRGYAWVTVPSGSGVFAFASVIDNITNDPTTVSMQP